MLWIFRDLCIRIHKCIELFLMARTRADVLFITPISALNLCCALLVNVLMMYYYIMQVLQVVCVRVCVRVCARACAPALRWQTNSAACTQLCVRGRWSVFAEWIWYGLPHPRECIELGSLRWRPSSRDHRVYGHRTHTCTVQSCRGSTDTLWSGGLHPFTWPVEEGIWCDTDEESILVSPFI